MNVDPFLIFAYFIGVFTVIFDVREYNRSSERPIERKIHPLLCLLSWGIVFMPKDIKIGWIWKQVARIYRQKAKAFFFYN